MSLRCRRVALLGLALVATHATAPAARTITDDAGREIAIPDQVTRVLAAGPPASVLLYTLAPELMVGWVRSLTPAERPYVPEAYRDLPEHGRLTGRGGTANLEMVLALEPDLILDAGSLDATYVSLADRVQEQTGIPYVTSIARLVRVEGDTVLVQGLDCLDGTPLLDLKPDRTLFKPVAPPQPGDSETADGG